MAFGTSVHVVVFSATLVQLLVTVEACPIIDDWVRANNNPIGVPPPYIAVITDEEPCGLGMLV